jgi:hypothetical protein
MTVREVRGTSVLAALPKAVIATGRPLRAYTTDTYNSLTLSGPVTAPAIIDITCTWEQKPPPRSENCWSPRDA